MTTKIKKHQRVGLSYFLDTEPGQVKKVTDSNGLDITIVCVEPEQQKLIGYYVNKEINAITGQVKKTITAGTWFSDGRKYSNGPSSYDLYSILPEPDFTLVDKYLGIENGVYCPSFKALYALTDDRAIENVPVIELRRLCNDPAFGKRYRRHIANRLYELAGEIVGA